MGPGGHSEVWGREERPAGAAAGAAQPRGRALPYLNPSLLLQPPASALLWVPRGAKRRIGDAGLGFPGALMRTPAIFHSWAFFPLFPSWEANVPVVKRAAGARGHARCRKRGHIAAPALPSVLPHYPAPGAAPAAPNPSRPRAWQGLAPCLLPATSCLGTAGSQAEEPAAGT